MKLFTNKNLKQKIIITVIICLMCNFAMPCVSNAKGIVDYATDAVQGLLLLVGDAGMYMAHLFFDSSNKDVIKEDEDKKMDIPHFTVTPEEIFQNKIKALDVNFFSPISKDSIAAQLQKYVSGGYNALRYISVVALLSVLVYLGIQIMMGSTGQKKAEFKEKIKGWFLAMCLLFAMHYLMVFSMFVIEQVTKSFSLNTSAAKITVEGDNKQYNTMEYTRIMAQKGSEKEQFGFIVVYLVLVVYTFIFAGKYLKRVVYMAFLTIIAPLVAATYPIEKSKSFNRWFKEYMTQLLIQPINMLTYFILVVKATELVKVNILYTVIAIAFINTADAMVRKIFNLAKAEEGKGAFGTGLISGAVAGKFIEGLGNNKGKSSPSGGPNQQKQPKMADNRPSTAGSGADDMYGGFDRDELGIGAGLGAGAALGAGAGASGSTSAGSEGETSEGGVPQIDKLGKGGEATATNNGEATDTTKGNANNGTNKDGDASNNEGSGENGGLDGDIVAGAAIGVGLAGAAAAGAGQGDGSSDGVISADIPSSDLAGDKGISGATSQLPNGSRRLTRKTSNGSSRFKSKMGSAAKTGWAGVKVAGKAGIKAGIKMATGVAGAAALGAATTIATADAKAGLKGMRAGYRMGSRIPELPSNAYKKAKETAKTTGQKVSDAVMKERYKKDPQTYKQYKKDIQVKRSDEAFKNDKNIQQKYKEEFGTKEYSKKMDEAMEYRKHGITDNDLITKAMKTKGFSKQEQVNLARISSSINSRKDLDRVEKDLRSRKVDEQKIQRISDTIKGWKGYKR